MKKTKTQKGITLVALIITIVVLLILAVVAISSIQNDGILSYANNAAVSYNQAQVNEQETLNKHMNYLDNFSNNVSNKKIEFIINGGVSGIAEKTYEALEGMTWAEWVDSEYNVDKYKIANTSWVLDETGEHKIAESISDSQVDASDLIVEGYTYVLKDYGELPGMPLT